MSVLIKGMEMPKDGAYWCEIGVAGEIATITIHGKDRKCFPLVPVPTHGRLIDADALGKVMSEGIAPSVKDGGFKHQFDIIRAAANAPTIYQTGKLPSNEPPKEKT